MFSVSSTKFLFTCSAVVALTFCFVADANAQRGFRIGNVLQAGGGQGFRLGGERIGMHFGGGQGASIGTQRFGMRFGNGQGARFGGANYGMQFGGGQGTQIGQLQTTTSGAPGTYYYGDVRNNGTYVQPMARRPIVGQSNLPTAVTGQPLVSQPATVGQSGPTMIPSTVNSPSGGVVQAQANSAPRTPSIATPRAIGTIANRAATTQTDIARQADAGTKETNLTRQAMKSKAPLDSTREKSILVNEDATTGKTPVEEIGSKSGGDDR